MTSTCGFDIRLERATLLLARPRTLACLTKSQQVFGTVVGDFDFNCLSRLDFFFLFVWVVYNLFLYKVAFYFYTTLVDMSAWDRWSLNDEKFCCFCGGPHLDGNFHDVQKRGLCAPTQSFELNICVVVRIAIGVTVQTIIPLPWTPIMISLLFVMLAGLRDLTRQNIRLTS